MWRKLIFLISFVVVLALANSAIAGILVHLSFDGGTIDEPFPEYVTDETGNVTVTAITDEIEGHIGSLVYGEGDPCYSVYVPGGTSAHIVAPAGFEIADGEQGYEMFALTGTEYTIETFIKVNSWPPDEGGYDNDGSVIIKKYVSDYYLDLQHEGDLLYQHGEETEPEGLSRIETPEGTIGLDEWYHIAAVFNFFDTEEPQKIYIDGEKIVGGGINVLNPGTDETVGIGHMIRPNGSRADFLDGWLDELRIADSALDPENFMLYGGGQIENKAAHPRPANSERHVCPEGVQLSWDPGEKTQDPNGHDVYLGTDFNDVKAAERGNHPAGVVYSEGQDSNEYPEDGDPLLELEPNTTYYWRVDQINDTNVWKGQVWEFTTDDGNAFDPSPADSLKGAAVDSNLVWTPSCLADSQNLYFGTNPVDVENGTGGTSKGSQSPDYNPGPLEPFTWYYWRVDTVIDGNTGKGAVWSFRTRKGVVMWYKFDGTLNADLPDPNVTDDTGNVTFKKHTEEGGSLKYRAGNGIYNPTGTSAAFDKAGLYRDDTGEEDLLRLDTYQYTIEMWLYINEGDYDGEDMMLVGKDGSWSFKISDLGDDDDLRWSHNNEDMDNSVLTDRFDEWMHIAAVFDQTDRLEGRKLYFNGEVVADGGASEPNPADANRVGIGCEWDVTDKKFDDFLDGRIDELRIVDTALVPSEFLYPLATNPNPFNGQGGIDPNDPNDPNILTWTPWEGASHHDVYFGTDYPSVRDAEKDDDPNNVYMGRFDTNSYPADGNTLEFELVTTYYWRIDEVNGSDIWKGRVWQFKTIYQILDPNLLLWYPFDWGSGEWAYDNSGYENHGSADSIADNWDANGRVGGCLAFKGDIDFLLPEVLGNAIEPRISDQVTIMVWLYGQTQDEVQDNVVLQAGGLGNYLAVTVCTEEGDVHWRAGNDTNDLLVWDLETHTREAWVDNWHHFAFVKDENEKKMYAYFDGDQVAWKPKTTSDSLADLVGKAFRFGARISGGGDYEGKMDDFKLYRIALSESEIKKEFRGSDLNLAWSPSPYDGQPDAPRDANLIWKPGDHISDVNGHQVFFGESWADVNSMTEPCSPQDACEYEPGPLELDTYYYWRIDEVNGPCTWPGPVWSFKTAEYMVVDDFESYNYTTKKIEETWWDYYQQYNDKYYGTGTCEVTCSWLLLGEYPWQRVHTGGNQSMRYTYDMEGLLGEWAEVCYAEAWLPIPEEEQDWTASGVEVLRLYFYGDSDNDTNSTEQMYVGIEDTDGNYAEIRYGEYDPNNEDMNDVNESEWHEWNVGLPHFNDTNYAAVANDVNLASIAKFYIGFGNRRNPPAPGAGCGGYGEVIFDDVRLNMPICVPELGPLADFSGNCIVDMADVGIMGEMWLIHDVNYGLDGIQEPNDANLVGWWTLDGDACDSSIYDHNSTIEGSYSWVAGHNDANAADLAVEFTGDKGGRVLVPDDNNTPALRPKHQVTACAWVYFTESQSSSRVVVKGQNDKETYNIEVDGTDQFNFMVRDPNENKYSVPREDDDDEAGRIWTDDWIHLAGTYDGNTVKSYVNGELSGSTDANFVVAKGWTLSQDTTGLAIGSIPESSLGGNPFTGSINDVRVYDYALSQPEVAWLASDGTGYVPLTLRINLYDKEKPGKQAINFKDFAELLDDWMEEAMWPASASP